MQAAHHAQAKLGGLTILELVTVISIITILVLLLLPSLGHYVSRAEKFKCTANLRTLYFGANNYAQQNGHWPQIDTSLIVKQAPEFARQWIDALQPSGIDQASWICPTTQKLLGNPDLHNSQNVRLDYIPMPFDSKQFTPYRWSRQPWFIERAAVHGSGNLIIFTDGSISDANDIISKIAH